MKNSNFCLSLIVFILVLALQQHAEAQNRVFNSVFGSGGTYISIGNIRMIGTVGQPVISQSSDKTHISNAGFWYQPANFATGVQELANEWLPREFRLEQNYPNPFNPATTIQFALPKRSLVTLKLFDMLGREVTTLVNQELQAGVHKVLYKAEGLPSEVYFYRLQADGIVMTKKLTLLK
jgi:hypothetical protein